jgi:hypothetical protein
MPKTDDTERALWDFLSAARLLALADAGHVPVRHAEELAQDAVKDLATNLGTHR